jgi:hypothetical protein
MEITATLAMLILCGVLGAVGQGIRAAVGLKSTATLQAQDPSLQSEFDTAYFLLSLMIGFIAGVLAGIVILINGLAQPDKIDPKTLLAVIAAGYTGTDFIENMFTNLLPRLGSAPALSGASDNQSASVKPANKSDPSAASNGPAAKTSAAQPSPEIGDLAAKMQAVSGRVADLHVALAQVSTSGGNVPGTNYPTWALTRDVKVAQSKYWNYIANGAGTNGLSVAVVLAIGSKESQWGLALKPVGAGAAGTGDFTPRDPAKWGVAMPTDGKGWGRGLMQIDWYSNQFAKTGNWQDAQANIAYGCELLAQKIKKFTDAGKDADTALRCGVSAYNGMSGPNSPYAMDVMGRAAWIVSQGLDRPTATAA